MADNRIHVEEDACPMCGKVLDALAPVNTEKVIKPKEGDISICIKCGALLQLGKNIKIERATPEGLSELEPEDLQGLYRVQAAIRLNKG